ncbi:MAG: hypothetical protein ACKONH_12130, partial [Planctomycetia bacterium]
MVIVHVASTVRRHLPAKAQTLAWSIAVFADRDPASIAPPPSICSMRVTPCGVARQLSTAVRPSGA